MARTRTLQQLRDETRSRVDLLAAVLSDTVLDRILNAQLARLYRLLVRLNQDFYLESSTISVLSGTAVYALPADFWRIVGIDYQENGSWYQMPRFVFAERNQSQSSSTRSGTAYRVMGSELRLRPTPDWSGTLRLYYIPAPPLLALVGDTWDGFAGYEDYAIVNAAIVIKESREEDVTALDLERKALYADIMSTASDIDDNEPDHVRDVESEVVDRWL